MTSLSHWVNLTNDANIELLDTLTKPTRPTCGCYDHVVNAFGLLDRLDKAPLDVPFPSRRPMVIELRDVDIGTPSTVSNKTLADLVDVQKLDPQTPVHLRCVYGGLSLFIVVDDVLRSPIKTNVTSLAINPHDKSIWGAKLGKFTPNNPVWGQSRFHGKTSALERTLKVPYLLTYTLTESNNFGDDMKDIPW